MTGEARDDILAMTQAARAQRRSAHRLVGLLQSSLRMVWAADRRLFVVSAGLQVLAGVMTVVQVLIIKVVLTQLIDAQERTGSVRATVLPVALLALSIGVTTVCGAAQTQIQRLLSELVTRQVWERILDVSGSVPLRRYDASGFYDHLQRVQNNAIGRPFLLTQALLSLIGGLTGTIGLAVAVAAIEPLLLPLMLVSAVPFYLAMRRGGNLEFAFAVRQTPRLRMRTYLQTLQTGREEAKEIRAFGTAGSLRGRYEGVYAAFLHDLRRHVRQRSIISLASSLASAVVLAITMLVIVWLVARHHLTLAAAGAAIVAVRLLAGQISTLFGGIQQIFESGLFLEDLRQFLVQEAPEDAAPAPVAAPEDGAGSEVRPASGRTAPSAFSRLEVDHVTFSYPGSQRTALRDVSLQIESGQVVALVGENGSGKTTLAKLLAALYQTDAGAIRWDDVDVSSYDSSSLRRGIGVIFQDFVRYQLPARTNVALGRAEADETDPAIIEACRQVGAGAIIDQLPYGYDTILSKAFADGQELSGGQWQRIALARAFYRDASFVILDEPSASLDPRAEYELFTSLRRMLAGRTVLYISHRLSTVRDADRIYVLSEGRIVEQGSHDELIEQQGKYAELFALQAAAYAGLRDEAAPTEPGG